MEPGGLRTKCIFYWEQPGGSGCWSLEAGKAGPRLCLSPRSFCWAACPWVPRICLFPRSISSGSLNSSSCSLKPKGLLLMTRHGCPPRLCLSRELIRSPAAMQHLGQSQIPRWVCLFSVLSVPIVIMEGVSFKGSGRHPSPCTRTHTGAHGHNLGRYGHSSEDTHSADHSLEGLGVRGQAEGTSSVFSAGRNDGD